MNSVSDIYGPDEIEELLEDLNRLEMASFDGVMMFDQASMPGGGNGPDGDRDDLSQDRMRPTSSEINMMQNEAVISGCITQPPDDDVEDFDIDGSQVRFFKMCFQFQNVLSISKCERFCECCFSYFPKNTIVIKNLYIHYK